MLWPPLPYEEWKPTRDTLHMKLQVIGKVRLALSPMEPEWAHVALYVTARGLTTSPIPHPSGEVFDIVVDLAEHRVDVRTGTGRVESVPLRAEPVAEFYRRLMAALERARVPVEISTLPSEVPDPIPTRASSACSTMPTLNRTDAVSAAASPSIQPSSPKSPGPR